MDVRIAPSPEREARITRGADVVAAQLQCSVREARALMNARAVRSRTSLEIVAIAVLAGDLRFT